MKFTYKGLHKWLTTHIGTLTIDQLRDLEHMVLDAISAASSMEHQARKALEQAAASVGMTVPDFLRLTQGEAAPGISLVQGQTTPAQRTGVRKPYLNPLEDDGQIHSVRENIPKPEWLVRAEQAGFSLAECHYKRIADAWRARGMIPLYADPVKVHADRVGAEPVRYQRLPRR